MKWPEFFPDSCPPQDSSSATGIVYRLINGQVPKEYDFKPYRQLYPDRVFDIPECQACSLSVYTDKADVVRLKKRIPATRNKKVACGSLNSSCGKLKPTPSKENSHHSWWVPTDLQPWLTFETVTVES